MTSRRPTTRAVSQVYRYPYQTTLEELLNGPPPRSPALLHWIISNQLLPSLDERASLAQWTTHQPSAQWQLQRQLMNPFRSIEPFIWTIRTCWAIPSRGALYSCTWAVRPFPNPHWYGPDRLGRILSSCR